MRKEDLVPGAPALCENCGEQITIGETAIYQDAYFEVFKTIDLDQIEIICTVCESLRDQNTTDWDSIDEEILKCLETLEAEESDQ